jgi:3-isopropylmalate dehydratase small subunit
LSKTKRRTGTELEHMRGLIKELEKQVRSLQKENKQLSKQKHIFIDKSSEEIETSSEDTFVELKPRKTCQSCFKGYLDEFEIMNKVFTTCSTCGERKKVK